MTLTRNQMKLIAVLAMTLDHVAAMLLMPSSEMYFVFRFLGRLTAPVMSFFIAEGFRYTRDRKKYGERLLLFAVVSQGPFMLAFNTDMLNVMFTLFISFLVLEIEESKTILYKNFYLTILFAGTLFCDWMVFVPLWVLIFYKYRDDTLRRNKRYILTGGVNAAIFLIEKCLSGQPVGGALYNLGFLLFLPILYMYDGSRGRSSSWTKWCFYIYYPVHLLVLYFVKIDIF